eukprot:2222621-Rhodomonas_salina.3
MSSPRSQYRTSRRQCVGRPRGWYWDCATWGSYGNDVLSQLGISKKAWGSVIPYSVPDMAWRMRSSGTTGYPVVVWRMSVPGIA